METEYLSGLFTAEASGMVMPLNTDKLFSVETLFSLGSAPAKVELAEAC